MYDMAAAAGASKDMLCVIPPYSVLIFNIDLMIVGEEKMKKDMFWSSTLKSENKS